MCRLSSAHRVVSSAAIAGLVALLYGCVLSEVREQASSVESSGRILGAVTAAAGVHGNAVIVVFRSSDERTFSVQSAAFPGADGRFRVTVPPGDYYLAAFLDRNQDARYQEDEPGRFYGAPTRVSVAATEVVEITIDVPATSGPLFVNAPSLEQLPGIVRNVGRITTLQDPRFSAANGALGQWRPLDFLEGPEGGLFMLQEYDARRLPVIFVHGMGGNPLEFTAAIEGLNLERYQPWILYYPSGLRLDMISDYFVTAVHGLQLRLGFRDFVVVAHSMGGLVTGSFVDKYTQRYPDAGAHLRLVVTVNSPMLGMASAASGVEHSPIVVPAWQDVAAGSEFVTRLAATPWSAKVRYHLVFSYSGNDSGDGTVSLDSQIPVALQAEAHRIHGFKSSHTGTLSAPAFLSILMRPLEEAAESASAAN